MVVVVAVVVAVVVVVVVAVAAAVAVVVGAAVVAVIVVVVAVVVGSNGTMRSPAEDVSTEMASPTLGNSIRALLALSIVQSANAATVSTSESDILGGEAAAAAAVDDDDVCEDVC